MMPFNKLSLNPNSYVDMAATTVPTGGESTRSHSHEWIGEDADDWDKRSITKSYHRMKAEDAIKYVDDLRKDLQRKDYNPESKVQLEKLEDEEHSILESRARLNKRSGPRSGQLKELERLFWEWRKEPDARGDSKPFKYSARRRKEHIKPNICPGPLGCKGTTRMKEVGEDDDPAHELNVYFMFFKKQGDEWKGEDYHKQKFPRYEHFPNQRITVHDALHDRENNPFKPIHDETGKPYLRYIHIPANHMGWIEQAVARYHDEHEEKDRSKRVKTSHTLSREFWKGQLHGGGLGRNPIHATHMRPRCSVIPGETQSLFGEQRRDSTGSESQRDLQGEKKTPHKDLAIFMPYLHWETSSRRARMTRTVQEVLNKENKEPKSRQLPRRTTRPRTATNEIQNIADQINYVATWQNNKKEETGKRSALAKYLLKLAQVWQDMDVELDERLIRHELLARDPKAKATEPSLHIRRTLDQSYFLNLKDTSQRDRDQVVYRATKWQGNLARVVMVDQLWLWILDDHTIITSYPKRWGRNKPDPSGIHKSLRERLARRDCKILSARHLACIIIDQCSNVFFDRTKPLDLRPEVMDIFAETLGDVNYYTTIAFKWFWLNVERSRTSGVRQSQKYLDINLEGTLLREAQDIAEELKIMISIYSKQLGVVKSFQKCLENLNGNPKARNKPLLTTKMLQEWLDSTKEQASSPQALTKKPKPISPAEMDFLDDLVEEVEDRRSEIIDLERAALQACQQLQELLSLKQQQASIVAAQASLERADQSVEQGKAIMAFTIMTIIFTPLGFFTSFFGMNNSLTGADWMTLGRQCLYMILISAIIIVIALSLAFKGSQVRHFMKSLTPEVIQKQFKASLTSLKKWLRGRKLNLSGKAAENGDESRPGGASGTWTTENTDLSELSRRNAAMDHFHLPRLLGVASLSKRDSRNNHSQIDIENRLHEHEQLGVRSKKLG